VKQRRDVKETFRIGLTLKEKTKKKIKASSERCIPTETTIEQRKTSRETQKRQQPQNQRQFLNSLARISILLAISGEVGKYEAVAKLIGAQPLLRLTS
jgi:hypothetical protein